MLGGTWPTDPSHASLPDGQGQAALRLHRGRSSQPPSSDQERASPSSCGDGCREALSRFAVGLHGCRRAAQRPQPDPADSRRAEKHSGPGPEDSTSAGMRLGPGPEDWTSAEKCSGPEHEDLTDAEKCSGPGHLHLAGAEKCSGPGPGRSTASFSAIPRRAWRSEPKHSRRTAAHGVPGDDHARCPAFVAFWRRTAGFFRRGRRSQPRSADLPPSAALPG